VRLAAVSQGALGGVRNAAPLRHASVRVLAELAELAAAAAVVGEQEVEVGAMAALGGGRPRAMASGWHRQPERAEATPPRPGRLLTLTPALLGRLHDAPAVVRVQPGTLRLHAICV
jgi:hypothetical protein